MVNLRRSRVIDRHAVTEIRQWTAFVAAQTRSTRPDG
jgi:hypothetical protein